jgi:hypothetical protein
MSRTSADYAVGHPGFGYPQEGDRFRCESCGMQIEVTADCDCKDGEQIRLECCGRPLATI